MNDTRSERAGNDVSTGAGAPPVQRHAPQFLVASRDDEIFLDLGNPKWVLQITPERCRIEPQRHTDVGLHPIPSMEPIVDVPEREQAGRPILDLLVEPLRNVLVAPPESVATADEGREGNGKVPEPEKKVQGVARR